MEKFNGLNVPEPATTASMEQGYECQRRVSKCDGECKKCLFTPSNLPDYIEWDKQKKT